MILKTETFNPKIRRTRIIYKEVVNMAFEGLSDRLQATMQKFAVKVK